TLLIDRVGGSGIPLSDQTSRKRDTDVRIQLARTIEVHYRCLHADSAGESPLETGDTPEAVDESGEIVFATQGVPIDGGAVLSRDRSERTPLVNREASGLDEVGFRRHQVCRGEDDDRRNTQCGFHFSSPDSAVKEASISASVAWRGKNFEDSRMKP